MNSRKRKAVAGTPVGANAPVYNIHITKNTINNYFAPAPAPTEAPAPRPDEFAWLPEKPPPKGRMRQTLGGELSIRCNHPYCKRRWHGPAEFIPEQNPRKKTAYMNAMAAITKAKDAKDTDAFRIARADLDVRATKICRWCRAIRKKSDENPNSTTGACKEEWERLKREKFHTCVKCGATRAMEANHLAYYSENMKEYNAIVEAEGVEVAEARIPKAERKIYSLSDYVFWPTHGGVEAMRAEAAKCEPLCGMCHALDPSSKSANENRADPDKVKREKYATQQKFTVARNQAKYKKEKRGYNDALKRAVGRCERGDCPRDGPTAVCVEGFEQCYEWDHIDPATKECGIAEPCGDATCFATAKPRIDAERAKCRLLCRNCHKTRTEWDPPAAGPSGAGPSVA